MSLEMNLTPGRPTRREVLRQGAAIGVGLATLGPMLAGCETHKDKPTLVTTGMVNVGPAGDYSAGTASTKYLAHYGIVLVNDSGPVIAIHPKCTHAGCMTKWDVDHTEFVCPCHRSTFDILGQVVHGPARKPLSGVAAETNADGTLSVNLDKLYALVAANPPMVPPGGGGGTAGWGG